MRTPYFTALLGIAFAAPALAGQQTPPPGPPAGMHDPLARMDANGDGVITRDEVIAEADRRFARVDTNGDGKITADEMAARMGGPRGPGGQDAPPPAGAVPSPPPPGGGRIGGMMLRRADANGDGIVTREEFRAAELRRFDMMDANHDGRIDAAERQLAMDAMRARFGGRGPGGDSSVPPSSGQ